MQLILLLLLAPSAVGASPALAHLDAMIARANAIDVATAPASPTSATADQAAAVKRARKARARAVEAAVAAAGKLRGRVAGADALAVDARIVDVYVVWREGLDRAARAAGVPRRQQATSDGLAEMDARGSANAAVSDAFALAEKDPTLALDAWRLDQRLRLGDDTWPIERCVAPATSSRCTGAERDALIARLDARSAAEAAAGTTAAGRLASAESWLAESHAIYVAAQRAPLGAPGAASQLWLTGAAWAAGHADRLLDGVRRDGSASDIARARDLQVEVLRWRGLVGVPTSEAPPPRHGRQE